MVCQFFFFNNKRLLMLHCHAYRNHKLFKFKWVEGHKLAWTLLWKKHLDTKPTQQIGSMCPENLHNDLYIESLGPTNNKEKENARNVNYWRTIKAWPRTGNCDQISNEFMHWGRIIFHCIATFQFLLERDFMRFFTDNI